MKYLFIKRAVPVLALGLGISAASVSANPEIESYRNSWQYRALMLQSEIDKGSPLSEASILMTHNSYNSDHYANAGSYVDPNHKHSLTEQLEMGVRLLELDTHWFSSELTACHGTDGHTGCSEFDGRSDERFAEVNSWLRQAENADQVLFIYVEDHMDGHYAEMSNMLDKYIGDKIYPAPSCGATLDVNISKADILNAGKQVVIYGDGGCSGTAGTSWAGYAYGHLFSTDNSVLASAPDCTNNSFNPSVINSKLTRIFEDSTMLSGAFGNPPPEITASYMQTLTTCGMGVIGLDQLDDNDSRHNAAIWSWNTNEPNNAGSGEDCAITYEPNRLADVACSSSYRFSCLDSNNNWLISSAAGNWSEGVAKCAAEGHTFDMPRNGYQNYLLSLAKSTAGVTRAWVNYSDIAEEGKWLPGDAPQITLPDADETVVYRQLRNGKGKCLDLEGRSSNNGTAVHQWSCHTDPADIDSQLWYQDETGRLHSKLNPDRCVDVSGAGTGEGTDVVLWDCHANDNQKWIRSTNNSLRPAHATDRALDISGGGNSVDGSNSHLWTYHGGKTQMWYWYTPAIYDKWIPDLGPAPGTVVDSSWSSSGGKSTSNLGNPLIELNLEQSASVTLDLMSSADTYLYLLDANGNQVTSNDDGGEGYNSRITASLNAGMYMLVAASYSSGQNASFQVTTSEGTISEFAYRRLKNGKGYCMDLESEGTSNGTDIHQWSCQSDNHQRWYQDSLGRLHSKAARFKCADVSGAGTGNGSGIQIYSCHSNNNQRWERGTNNSFRPKHATSKAFDIDGGNTWSTKGSDAHLWDYHGGKTQQWVWID